jgi:hypothetical protein
MRSEQADDCSRTKLPPNSLAPARMLPVAVCYDRHPAPANATMTVRARPQSLHNAEA